MYLEFFFICYGTYQLSVRRLGCCEPGGGLSNLKDGRARRTVVGVFIPFVMLEYWVIKIWPEIIWCSLELKILRLAHKAKSWYLLELPKGYFQKFPTGDLVLLIYESAPGDCEFSLLFLVSNSIHWRWIVDITFVNPLRRHFKQFKYNSWQHHNKTKKTFDNVCICPRKIIKKSEI